MKHSLIIGFFLALFISCSSPEEPPKPSANIDFQITQLPFTISYDWWDDNWYADLTLLITENNNVGATINSVKTDWYLNNSSVASTQSAGKRVPAGGSVYISFTTLCPAKYKPQTMTIVVSGKDDNGYSFSKSKSYNLTWNLNSATLY
jgi:hypothetical protein